MAANKEKLKNAVDELNGNKIGKLTVINYQYTHKKKDFKGINPYQHNLN